MSAQRDWWLGVSMTFVCGKKIFGARQQKAQNESSATQNDLIHFESNFFHTHFLNLFIFLLFKTIIVYYYYFYEVSLSYLMTFVL